MSETEKPVNFNVIKTGSSLKKFNIGVFIVSVIAFVTSIFAIAGIDNIDDKVMTAFSIVVVLSIFLIILSITTHFTLVRSLTSEDILTTGIERLVLGEIKGSQLKEDAGKYLKTKLVNSNFTPDELGELVGNAMMGKKLTYDLSSNHPLYHKNIQPGDGETSMWS